MTKLEKFAANCRAAGFAVRLVPKQSAVRVTASRMIHGHEAHCSYLRTFEDIGRAEFDTFASVCDDIETAFAGLANSDGPPASVVSPRTKPITARELIAQLERPRRS